ncbi:retrovirus-related pol polyprotein from transposon TNT 1-94 [Tanacetum coccineum]
MSKVLQERGFGSLPSSTETNSRDHVKSISTTVEADTTLICRIGSPQYGKDPGSFTLPCYINNVCFENALADLGASVSVMPLSTYLNLGLGKLAHTKLTVELADRTVKHPKGIAENVLVGIGKFIFPLYFIILDMPEDVKVPLILRRPFLSTAHAKIDVFKRKITLKVRGEKIIFKSVKPGSNLIKRVYMLSLREHMELDLEAWLIGETLVLNRSLDPLYGDYIELNDLNVPLELRRDQVDDLIPIIEERENMGSYRDQDMGDVIFGEPFCKTSCVDARRFDGLIRIHNGNDNVTYQMARSHPRFKHLSNAQCNKIRPLLKDLAGKKTTNVGEVSIIWNSCS